MGGRTVKDIAVKCIICLGFHDTLHRAFLTIKEAISSFCVQVSDEHVQIHSTAEGPS